jgi:hypothetical protein
MSTNGQVQSSNAADFHAQADEVFGRMLLTKTLFAICLVLAFISIQWKKTKS